MLLLFRFWAIKFLIIGGTMIGAFFIPRGSFSQGMLRTEDIIEFFNTASIITPVVCTVCV